jgi:hypothetical protein
MGAQPRFSTIEPPLWPVGEAAAKARSGGRVLALDRL